MRSLHRLPSSCVPFGRTVAAACAVVLASCGGGGGDGGGGPIGGTSIGLAPSSTLAQQCTAELEKSFLRSWIDETYLWYQDVRTLPATTLDPSGYATPEAYFEVLKTPLTTASGKAKDEFHFIYDTAAWTALSQSGIAYGYGFQVALQSSSPPRRAVVAFTEPGTPSAANGIGRGAEILSIDGVDFVNGADAATLNAGLFPTGTGSHTFTIRDFGASATRSVTMTAQQITQTPVQNVRTLPAPNQNVGYLLFNDHIATSEALLVAAIEQLRAAGVSDLVLDLRYNGGGYLDIASELAYMIAGPANTSGKFFERLSFNDRNPFNRSVADNTTPFHPVSQAFSGPPGQPLPSLDLSRVYVLTSPDTCSASEAIVNGLRGAWVAVHLIGGTTCGKPYGFFPRDNCGTTYFAIQFFGVNFAGFGDYSDGFAPTCAVADDFAHALGDPDENQLEVALALRSTGACVAPLGTRPGALALGDAPQRPVLVRSPLRENRIYR